jgi:hypothetical protein
MIKYLIPVYLISLLIQVILLFFIGSIFYINVVNNWTAFGGALILTITYYTIYFIRRRNGEVYGSIDKTLLKIIIIFCKDLKIKKEEISYYVLNLFKSYNSDHTKTLFKTYFSQNNDLKINSVKLINTSIEAKEFLMISLFEIASKDRLLSIEEERLIGYIGAYMRFPKVTYQKIKQSYVKSGLKEERKLIEEEYRKKLTESFLPYNAYKILGVTPNITKDQLKKIYRKLAKKYHPDKYHGQGQKIIDKAEEKFQKITEAYEIILKSKK